MKAAVRCVFAFAVVSVSMGDLYDQHRLRHRALWVAMMYPFGTVTQSTAL